MRKHPTPYRVVACILLIASIGFILYVTLLTREPAPYKQRIFTPFHSYFELIFNHQKGWLSQNLLNMLLFMPLGASCFCITDRNNRSKFKIAVIAGFLLSCFVEITQYFTKLGFFETDDIINNIIGTAIGDAVCWLVYSLVNRKG